TKDFGLLTFPPLGMFRKHCGRPARRRGCCRPHAHPWECSENKRPSPIPWSGCSQNEGLCSSHLPTPRDVSKTLWSSNPEAWTLSTTCPPLGVFRKQATFAHPLVGSYLQPAQYNPVGHIHLPIGLRVGDRGKVLLNSHLLAPRPNPLASELRSIIRYQNFGNPEPTAIVVVQKFDYFLLSDPGQWFSFHPLRKVVDRHDQEFSLPCCLRHWPHQVDSPLREQNWCTHGGHCLSGLVDKRAVFLTLQASFGHLLGIRLHCRPEIPCSQNLCHNGSSLAVVAAASLVHLSEDILAFFLSHTSQMRPCVQSL
ncbi:Unknown protein, partial [Striga hermonthica]